jgi:hypothetical protein
MLRLLIGLTLVLAASALPAQWAAAQFKNEGMGVLVPPTRGIPHPPGSNPMPPPASAPAPVPPPAPAQSSSGPPPSPPPASGQQAK